KRPHELVKHEEPAFLCERRRAILLCSVSHLYTLADRPNKRKSLTTNPDVSRCRRRLRVGSLPKTHIADRLRSRTWRPVKYKAILRSGAVDTIPLVNTP